MRNQLFLWTLLSMINELTAVQEIKDFFFTNIDCPRNCNNSLLETIDRCTINYVMKIEDLKEPYITFEMKETNAQNWEVLFAIDLTYDCNGYKDNVDFYCTEDERNVYILSINANKIKRNYEAMIRFSLTSSDGKKIYSGHQHFPNVYGTTNATGQLKINGERILADTNCSVTVKAKELVLEFSCVSSAGQCVIEITVNYSIVAYQRGKYASYKETYKSGLTLNVSIRFASCVLNGDYNFMSCSVITETTDLSDDKGKSKQDTNSDWEEMIIIICFSVIGFLILCGVIALIIFRAKKYGCCTFFKRYF
ncbi:unnamed protein product [Lymnaea stagnalis]|uniref:Uncharacterized protein n=1 Tax=Lymnaea stagnalis TaxID=6523 RepID=A0AAV2I9J8_LYMST